MQIRGMRWLAMVVLVASSSAAGAAPASNPAFAGIGLQDMPMMGCLVFNLVNGAPAKEAGVLMNDLILSVDGVPLVGATQVPPCTVFQQLVTSHVAGDTIKLDLRRGMDSLQIKVTLSSRAEVLHRRYAGKSLGTASLPDADDPRRTYELSELTGHVTVIGFFHADACIGCATVFDRLRDELRDRLHDDAPDVLAVNGQPTDEAGLKQQLKAVVAKDKDAKVMIAADQACTHGEFVHVVDVVKGEGITKFAVNIEKDASAPALATP